MSTVFVSNVPNVARQTDTKLVNPVDLAFDKCGKIWVSILTNNLVQQYDRKCGKMLSSVTVTTPTGLDYHCGVLYIASQNGTVYTLGCKRDRDPTTVMSSTTPATYLSVTGGGTLQGLAWHCGLLYITVWDRGYVGVYKDKQAILSIVNDGLVAFSFRPLGIRSLGGRVYITYSDQATSVGAGYVDVYTPPRSHGGGRRSCGHSSSQRCRCDSGELMTLIARDALAYPYGLVLQDDKLLVGNRGTGRIWTYDRETGDRVENSNDDITRSVNDGLMGMREWDGLIYFVAANDNGLMGSLGYIQRG